ncbi:2,5-diketo-D-gluconic acid reductase B [Alcanivorax sp. ALC70]|nr:2,5-diketo-D-gluconic acid reductase B [Alcanivorax sp. ALC70]
MAKASIPSLGLGTFRLKGEQLMGSIHKALDLGYRHIDTAQMYDNEETVGAALDAHDVPRDEVFLTTKIWHDRLRHDDLLKSLQESVNRLRVDSVDLALIHWPSPGDEVPMEEYIGALAEAKQRAWPGRWAYPTSPSPSLRKHAACPAASTWSPTRWRCTPSSPTARWWRR